MADVQGMVQLREHFLCLNLVIGAFFPFLSVFVVVVKRPLFMDGQPISVHSFEREEGR